MKRNLFKALFVIAVLAALVSVFAVTAYATEPERTVTASGECGAEGDNLTWTLYDDGELVISGDGSMKNWTSSSSVPWYSYRSQITKVTLENNVTSIGGYAFSQGTLITDVEIPESVTHIGSNAFYNCTALKNAEIPNGVTSLANAAFYACKSLVSIELPVSVTSIGDYAFRDCINLKSVTVYMGLASFGSYVFENTATDFVICGGAYSTAYKYANSQRHTFESIDIPKSEHVSGVCGAEGDNVKWVLYSDGALEISGTGAMNAFSSESNVPWYNYRSLIANVTIKNGVTNIENYAFYSYGSLQSIQMPASVTTIGSRAIYDCYSLTSIQVAEGNTAYVDVNGVLFSKDMKTLMVYPAKKAEKSYVIPDGVTTIKEYAFDRGKFESVEIPDSVTTIEWNAFKNCTAIMSIEIPAGVRSVAGSVFINCQNLNSVTVYSAVTTFGSDVFRNTADDLVIYGGANSTIQEYAVDYDHDFVVIELSKVELASGVCGTEGDNVEWAFYNTGELKISGTGAMNNFTSGSMPWKSFSVSVRMLEIENGVTNIGNEAFYYCGKLTSVNIPETVASIGYGAFSRCSALTYVEIPEGVTSIGENVFQACTALTGVKLPSTVTSIGDKAFLSCNSLTDVEVSEKNLAYVDVDGVLFTKDMNTLIVYPAGKSQASYTIPNGVTLIVQYAFCGNPSLANLQMPESLTTIEDFAFSFCKSLASIEIPAKVLNVGFQAFASCTSLNKVTVYSSITAFDNQVFTGTAIDLVIYGGANSIIQKYAAANNHRFVVIDIPKVVIDSGTCGADGDNIIWTVYTNGETVISGSGEMKDKFHSSEGLWVVYRSRITKLIIENGITNIGAYAFIGCSSITSLDIPESVTSIGNYAFQNCNSLTSIYIPESVTSIGDYAFNICSSLTSIKIPKSVTGIGKYTFGSCRALVSIELHNGITSIGDYAFNNCGVLAGIEIPASVKSIGANAFINCLSLTSVEIPASVTSIGNDAFHSCSKLNSVTIYGGIMTFGSRVFSYTSSELMIYGGENSSAQRYAAANTHKFGVIEIPNVEVDSGNCGANGDNVKWTIYNNGEFVISGTGKMGGGSLETPWYTYCSNITKVTVQSGVTSISSQAFQYSPSLLNIEIAATVMEIGEYAFRECAKLNSATIYSGIVSFGHEVFKYFDSDFVIYGGEGSTVQKYAAQNRCNFVVIDLPKVEVLSGNCGADGDNLTWTLYSDGELVISGTGKMMDYNTSSTPWDSYITAITSVTMEVGVTTIGEYAFYCFTNLTSVEIPESVMSIGSHAFYYCSNLKGVEIPESVTSIGHHAFVGCSALTSVEIPESVTTIGYEAFSYCDNLTTVTVFGKNTTFESSVFKDAADDLVIKGYAGSTAEAYAAENGHTFVAFAGGEIKFLSASLSLYNNIAVNFKANKDAMDDVGFITPYAVFEFGGRTYTVTDYTVETMMVSGVDTEVYVFAFKNLAPDRMNDEITATLYASFDGVEYAGKSVSYSVAKYCYNQLGKCTEKTALATVCVDLLNYGSATQEYTGYRTDALANASLTDAQKSWGTQEDRALRDFTVISGAPANERAQWKSASLNLRDNIAVEMKFQATDITGIYVEIEMYGRKFRIDEFGYDEQYGWYVVEFDRFSATHMSERMIASIRDAEGNVVSKFLAYSVESYAARKQTEDGIGKLVKAMMKYGDAAIAYGAEQN